MDVALVAVLLDLLALGLLLAALVQLRAARRERDALSARLALVEAPLPSRPELDGAFSSGPRRLLTVELLNPLELAASRVKGAKVIGAMAPELLRRMVYEQAVRVAEEQLAKHGVEAEVRLHVVG